VKDARDSTIAKMKNAAEEQRAMLLLSEFRFCGDLRFPVCEGEKWDGNHKEMGAPAVVVVVVVVVVELGHGEAPASRSLSMNVRLLLK